jgi:hypothetical protein
VSPLPSLPSLDLLDSESIRQLEVQERRSDSLDSKAGVVLGFAGVLVPLSIANLHSNVAHVGTGFAALAALLASVGFFPRNSPALNLRHLRDTYLTAEEGFTRLRVLDTRIAMYERTNRRLQVKATAVSSSMAALAVAVIVTVVAGILG